MYTSRVYLLLLLSGQAQFGVILCISSFDNLVSTFDLNIQGFYMFYSLIFASDQVEDQGSWASC